jgi:hypothetical protein
MIQTQSVSSTILYVHSFLSSLVFTICIETALLYFLLQFVFAYKDSDRTTIIVTGLFANFATVPYVWFAFPYVTAWSRNTSTMLSEPFVFFVEAIVYRLFLRTSWTTSFLVSLICNLASYLIGPVLRAHGFWPNW